MAELKLSQLADDVVIANSDALKVWTVEELKNEIEEFGNKGIGQWFIAKPQEWQPCAQSMIENYIDSQADGMYEDWDERALDCVSEELIQKMQALLDEAFKGDSVKTYYEWGEPVGIDILPKLQ